MTTAATADIELSQPCALAGEGVKIDRAAGIIRNVSVLSVGPAKGHGFSIDTVMLSQVAKQITAAGGVRSRLSHPQGDDVTALIGRVQNARVEGDRVRGDLHLANFAADGPQGDLRAYVLGIAEEDPGAAGLSIVFKPGEFHEDEDGRLFGRSESVNAVDLVGQPAANRSGLLSQARKVEREMVEENETTTTALSAPEVAAERARVVEITALGRDFAGDLDVDFVSRHVEAGTAADAARSEVMAKLRETRKPVRVIVGQDNNRGTLANALTDSVCMSMGAQLDKPHQRARQFGGMGFLEGAREYLRSLGADVSGMTRVELADLVIGRASAAQKFPRVFELWQGVGTLPAILADAMNKTARIGYENAPRTWSLWARKATAPDFKQIHRPQLSDISVPTQRAMGGELKHVTIGDSEEVYELAEYGEIVALTRRALVNDDLNAFDAIPRKLILASRALEDDLAYAQVTDNGDMADGTALFHADHVNLAGSGAALSVATLGAARAAMAKQTGPKGNFLALQAAHLLVPSDIQTDAEQLVASLVDPSKSNQTANAEFIRNLSVVGEPRLAADSATAWYLTASPAQIDTVEVAFLESEQAPLIETDRDFDTDHLRIKLRHTVAAKVLDHRGLYKNPGA